MKISEKRRWAEYLGYQVGTQSVEAQETYFYMDWSNDTMVDAYLAGLDRGNRDREKASSRN